MTRKQIIITGGTSGIGKETARALLKKGYQVTLAVRNEKKAKSTVDELSALGAIDHQILDLSSFRSIRQFATQYKASQPTTRRANQQRRHCSDL